MAAEQLQVSLAYATPTLEYLVNFKVEPGTTIEQGIRQCGVLNDVAGIDLTVQPVGIFGKKKPLDTVLREADRIEIYRPLVADPKDSRRRRAEKKQAAA